MSNDPIDINQQQVEDEKLALEDQFNVEQEQSDIKTLMSSKAGRRIAYGFLERAGVFRTSFSTDPLVMAFNEGQRNEGLRLIGLINTICPEKYLTMMKEQEHGRNE